MKDDVVIVVSNEYAFCHYISEYECAEYSGCDECPYNNAKRIIFIREEDAENERENIQ